MGTSIAIVGYAEGRAQICAWLRALVCLNRELMQLDPLPPIYSTRTRYAPEPRGQGYPERYDPAPLVYRRGWGDCDDLAAWRTAELQLFGEGSSTIELQELASSRPTARRWHAVVRRAGGALEDPSKILQRERT